MKKGWTYKSFADCIDKVSKQKQVKSKDYKSSGLYPIVSQEKELISGYWDDESFLYKHSKPVIIFGDHTKEIKYIDFDFIVGADGTQILSPKEGIDTKFFYYALLATPIRTLGYARHFKLLKEKSFLIPPLSDQFSIVSRLDAAFVDIDALKANAEKQLSEARQLFQAELTECMRPKEGWEKKALKDISKYSIGLTYKPSDVSEKGIIVLRSSNIQNDILDLKDIVRVTCPIKESLYVQDGDILMCSRNGSARLVGKVALIHETSERMTYGTFMMIIRGEYNPYLLYFFKSDDFRNQIKHGEANMINQITRYMLDDVFVNVPPKSEVCGIVSQLDFLSAKVRELEEVQRKTLAECDALKQAMLREVFE